MKNIWIIGSVVLLLAACGEDRQGKDETEEQTQTLSMQTDKEKISYTIGIQQGTPIMGADNPNRDKFDKAALVAGFKSGFTKVSDEKRQSCMMALQNMMGGGQGMPFNDAYAKEGCNCIGMLTAADIYMQFEKFDMTDRVDLAMLTKGFQDGLNGTENRLSQEEQQRLFENLNADMQTANMQLMAKVEAEYQPRWEEIKAIPGVQELENGIYLQTLRKGSGASPQIGEDIEASYILKRFDGSIKETSEKLPDGKFQANLSPGSLIQGWVIGFQAMKVGGKYRLYVPAAMAYGEEPLDFEIEFFQKGPGGTLVQPRRMPQ
jgi:FKBP-type peptidyl-prolyl cis-trans isomerase